MVTSHSSEQGSKHLVEARGAKAETGLYRTHVDAAVNTQEALAMGEAGERPTHRSALPEVQEVVRLYRRGLRLGFGVSHDPLGQALHGSISLGQDSVNRRCSPSREA